MGEKKILKSTWRKAFGVNSRAINLGQLVKPNFKHRSKERGEVNPGSKGEEEVKHRSKGEEEVKHRVQGGGGEGMN